MTDDEQREKNREKMRAWRAANREKSRAYNREHAAKWRAENRERARELNEASRQKRRALDPEGERAKQRENMRRWRKENPEAARAADQRWREAHPEEAREKSRRWREAHPEAVAAQIAARSETRKERRRDDPEWAQEQRDRTAQWKNENPERVMRNYKNYRGNPKNVLRDQLTNARNRARKAALPFDDALFGAIVSAPSSCEACGTAFEPTTPNPNGGHVINLRALSIDRVDNTKGYTLDNVGYLCFGCNAIKKTATVDELKAIVAYIERHFARRQ